MFDDVRKDLKAALEELHAVSRTGEGGILVVGCSTSEVIGKRIGTGGSMEAAREIYSVIAEFCASRNLFLAAQCCEHLNRSIVVEREVLKRFYLTQVNAIPHAHAGGSFATTAYENMNDPVLTETIVADIGIDIGNTLIGMHIRPVAVPVRVSVKKIGEANLVLARSRCKYIGGERAIYNPDLA